MAESGFGASELHAAFAGLPDSFEEIDPFEFGLSISDLGLEEYFRDIVTFGSDEPLQWFMAISGELSDLDRIEFDLGLSSSQAFLQEFRDGLGDSVEGMQLNEARLLELPTIGDKAVGAWVETVIEGIALKVDTIVFRRGNIVGLVYNYYPPDSVPTVGSVEIAKLLETAITEYLVSR